MKNKKSLMILLLVSIIGIVGLTIAFFASSTSVENEFLTSEYGSTHTATFVSPENWLPGDISNQDIFASNTGQIDQAVRIKVEESWVTANNGTLSGWIHADGTKSNHTTETELATDERAVILGLANASDWTKVGDYYYYNYKLAPGEDTTSFLESITFNSKTNLNDTCTSTTENGVTTTTCSSSDSDYDNATYTLTLTIETVQYNKYATAWSTGNTVNILEERPVPGAQYLVDNATNPANAEYNTETKGKMFVFTHGEAPNQVTETRYIGDDPNNYVYFNCDDMSDQSSSTCEVWRILGVFDVDDGTGNVEQRMKLVRGSSFATAMYWNDGSNNNDWTDTNSSLKNFLNGDYYNRTGDAATYGLKTSAKSIIDNAVYYLGATYDSTSHFGSTEEVYAWERGNKPCGACNSDTTKLTWTGKVGLMYPSDEYMVYGNGVNTECYNDPGHCYNTTIPSTGWVYNSNIREGLSNSENTWFLSSSSIGTNLAFFAYGGGSLDHDYINNIPYGVRPVVYLKASVEIDSGAGTELDPYKLK